MTGRINKGAALLFCLVFLTAILASGCSNNPGRGGEAAGSPASSFADYREEPVQVTPAVKPYAVEPDLGNITNRSMFEFSPGAASLLVKNGFAVVPNSYMKEFFILYEENRYAPVPSFITTDSMLHNYHLFFNHLLRVIESDRLAPGLAELNGAMQARSLSQYEALRGTKWEEAARRNLAFFTVAVKLTDAKGTVPAAVQEEVNRELELIEGHQGIQVSPVMGIGAVANSPEDFREDYTQYIPRGHYEKSPLLTSYFKAMMWYGRMNFRLTGEDGAMSAALITLALNDDGARENWRHIYDTTVFFVGKSDDITYDQMKELLDKVYGPGADVKKLSGDGDRWRNFLEQARELPPPAINSLPPENDNWQPGFRFMGQRYTLDADVFQRLIYASVLENSRGQLRVLPRGLDVAAALGSREAYTILDSLGDTDFGKYKDNMTELQADIAALPDDTWIGNLYWGWLNTLRTLTPEKAPGYPSFMTNPAWARKELNTFLGSWTELKYDTILYAKPVYAEAGGGGDVDDRGYVEPNPHLYARLAALANMTGEGLAARELISQRDRESLERLEQLALRLKAIAEKELSDSPLSDEDYELIRSYGVQLEHFWLEALRDEGIDHRSAAFDRPAAVVVDVANDAGGGQVLQEATGNISVIYAVVPVEGQLRIAKGGVYSYYEFPWPMNDRLTDKKWHQMLNEDNTPPLPEWTGAFTARDELP